MELKSLFKERPEISLSSLNSQNQNSSRVAKFLKIDKLFSKYITNGSLDLSRFRSDFSLEELTSKQSLLYASYCNATIDNLFENTEKKIPITESALEKINYIVDRTKELSALVSKEVPPIDFWLLSGKTSKTIEDIILIKKDDRNKYSRNKKEESKAVTPSVIYDRLAEDYELAGLGHMHAKNLDFSLTQDSISSYKGILKDFPSPEEMIIQDRIEGVFEIRFSDLIESGDFRWIGNQKNYILKTPSKNNNDNKNNNLDFKIQDKYIIKDRIHNISRKDAVVLDIILKNDPNNSSYQINIDKRSIDEEIIDSVCYSDGTKLKDLLSIEEIYPKSAYENHPNLEYKISNKYEGMSYHASCKQYYENNKDLTASMIGKILAGDYKGKVNNLKNGYLNEDPSSPYIWLWKDRFDAFKTILENTSLTKELSKDIRDLIEKNRYLKSRHKDIYEKMCSYLS